MGMILGGPNCYRVFLHKRAGIACALHWINGEPAMALFPVPKRLGGAGFVICLSALHKYANKDGSPTPYLVQQAAKAAAVMAMDTTRFTINAIADVIMERIEDVVKMPPMPDSLRKSKGKPVGTIAVIANGQKVTEAEVMDLPPSVNDLSVTH